MIEKSKILIVDDETDVLETIKDSLEEYAYQVDVEMDPQEALEKIKNNYYDLVITDIQMPNVSGVDIVKAVKSTARDTLIIVITGFASTETAIKSLQFGVYDYVQKPILNIQQIVERALEKLHLQRKNKELGIQIEEMLAKISLLHDISSILYQVSDFNEAAEMILDTLTEGLKITKVGLLLNNNNNSLYKIAKYRGLNSTLVNKIEFKSKDLINNQKLFSSKATELTDLNGVLNISDSVIPIDESLKRCIIVPINFHIHLAGYIIVFLGEQEITESDNLVKLLKIFSTQIAPVLHSFFQETDRIRSVENNVSKFIGQKIIESESSLSPISFAIFRIVMLNTPKEISLLNDYMSVAKNLIIKQAEEKGELNWLTEDTAIFTYPATDLFTIEKFCLKLIKIIEKLQISGNKETLLTIKYSCVSYPQVASSPGTLINILWKNLFEEL
ncbi:response regulator [Calditrichota bacterium]